MVLYLTSARRCAAWSLLVVVLSGCSDSESGGANSSTSIATMVMVPADGTVTVDGKPLVKAVVTFLPPSGPAVGIGETDEQGHFRLSALGRDGVPPGKYRVAVSYLVSAEGVPQGTSARDSLVQGPGMLSAKEQLPAEYSDLGRSRLSAEVKPEGGPFNFEISGVEVQAAEKKSAEVGAEESGKPEGGPPAAKKAAGGDSEGSEKPAPGQPDAKKAGANL